MKHVVIIPGLGEDQAVRWVKRIVSRWEDETTKTHIFDSRWNAKESFVQKRQRLLEWLDGLNLGKDSFVELQGISAGGPLAMVLFKERSDMFERVILIAAKLKRPELIGPHYHSTAPALVETVTASQAIIASLSAEQSRKFMTYRPLFDGVVAVKDMVIAGTRSKIIPVVGHAFGIGWALLFQLRPR